MKNKVKKIVLYGTGKVGKEIFKKFQYRFGEYEVFAFVDNDHTKRDITLFGKRVLSVNEARKLGLDIVLAIDDHDYSFVCNELESNNCRFIHYKELLGENALKVRHEIGESLKDRIPLPAPHTILIGITGGCNFKCVFCPCNNTKYLSNDSRVAMSFSDFMKIVSEMNEFPEQIDTVELCATTEPLLHPDIASMIKVLKERNSCKNIRMVTNGSLLNYGLNRRLVDNGLDHIIISVEALDSMRYEKMCGVAVNFDRFIQTITDLYNYSRGKTIIEIRMFSDSFEGEEDYYLFEKTFEFISDYHHVRHSVANLWPDYKYSWGGAAAPPP
ncbi:MAG: radical SAM protein, partial [Bacteroidales bacterium]|nr:radical SAM protein [Bacteroidales bacterium]